MAVHILRWTAIALLITTSATGCVALAIGAAGGAAGAVYVKGWLEENVDATVEQVHSAAIRTLEAQGLPVLDDDSDVATLDIKSKYADGRDIWIKGSAITSEVTKVRIRVGLTGEQDRSMDLLNRIKGRL